MKRVPIAEFKARCSQYVDEAATEDIVITRHGRDVAKVVAPDRERDVLSLIGALKGQLIADPDDDLLSAGIRWDAES